MDCSKTLPRYLEIDKNKLSPKYLITKKIPARFTKDMSLKELWRVHDACLNKKPGKPGKSLLDLKIEIADRIVKKCVFCEHKCRVDRAVKKGFCGVGTESRVFGAHMHWGEEACLVPSATMFFSGCTLRCAYCQNWPESINYTLGTSWSPEGIAEWIKHMRAKGCRNINFVGGDPTPNIHNILKALGHSKTKVPILFNSNAYCSREAMKLLNGVIDVFLFDFRYFSDECGSRLSGVNNYPRVAKRNHKLALEQAELLVRLLVLPGHLECDAKLILKWIKNNLGVKALVNVMGQYRPFWRAHEFPEISKPLSFKEYEHALNYAKELGLVLT